MLLYVKMFKNILIKIPIRLYKKKKIRENEDERLGYFITLT